MQPMPITTFLDEFTPIGMMDTEGWRIIKIIPLLPLFIFDFVLSFFFFVLPAWRN